MLPRRIIIDRRSLLDVGGDMGTFDAGGVTGVSDLSGSGLKRAITRTDTEFDISKPYSVEFGAHKSADA